MDTELALDWKPFVAVTLLLLRRGLLLRRYCCAITVAPLLDVRRRDAIADEDGWKT